MASSAQKPTEQKGFFGKIFSAIFGSDANAAQTDTATTGTTTSAPANTNQSVDVGQILDAKNTGTQKLNWKTSIVDLMKLLNIDSSLDARKSLADELGFTGDTSDSATMNMWLHKQVMQKLKENGGKLPADLQD